MERIGGGQEIHLRVKAQSGPRVRAAPSLPGQATPSPSRHPLSFSRWRQSPLYTEAEGAVRGSWKAVFTAQ